MLRSLPHVAETVQWGNHLVFWVGDKAIGGKMFALADLDGRGGLVVSFAAGPERSAELCEREGFRPAPYLARAHWVAADRWDVLPVRDWAYQFAEAHRLVLAKLPPRTTTLLALPRAEYRKAVAERRRTLPSNGIRAKR